MYPFGLNPDGWHDANRQPRPRDAAWGDDGPTEADEELATRVANALRGDPEVYGRRLELLVQNRVVILLGEIGSDGARRAASARVWSVPGVYDVCNRLAVIETPYH